MIKKKELYVLFTLAMIIGSLIFTGCNTDDDDLVVDPGISGYPIVGTNQIEFYDASDVILAPAVDEAFYGQNANYTGNTPVYQDNGDGTITDLVSGLVWQQSTDTDGDGNIDFDDKMSYDDAVAGASTFDLAGYDDWRLPTVKELYSLIIFSGIDPSSYEGTSTDDLVPFINTTYFNFSYGDQNAGESIIDAQYATSNLYVGANSENDDVMFGVNFANGCIKTYETVTLSEYSVDKKFYVMYVRGNNEYGTNDLQDNSDGTITDNASGLMWMQDDNEEGVIWEDAMSYAEGSEFADYTDWRLPDAKELQSIVDYTRSPSSSSSAAINLLFNCTEITNELDEADYPYYWSNTTHANWDTENSGSNAAYISFGRAIGYVDGSWIDINGAGAQRSDPKVGDPNEFPEGSDPQGDAVRVFNYVRLVRNAN